MNSFITWIGGKKLLRKNILEQFPDSTTYNRYIEVFGGAAWVLFGKDKIAKLEVYNDINGKLHYVGDGESEICAEYGAKHLAEEILNRIIGLEDDHGSN